MGDLDILCNLRTDSQIREFKPLNYTHSENLKMLLKSNVLQLFVKENRGNWDHQMWLDLLERVKLMGFTFESDSPNFINPDNIGLTIERFKREYKLTHIGLE